MSTDSLQSLSWVLSVPVVAQGRCGALWYCVEILGTKASPRQVAAALVLLLVRLEIIKDCRLKVARF